MAALIASDQLPPPLAECFDPALTYSTRPDWGDVVTIVELYLENPELDSALRGPLALMGAYAYVATCEYMLDELVERAESASRLVQLANEHGVEYSEWQPVSYAAHKIYESGVELDEMEDEEDEEGEEGEEGEERAAEAWELLHSDDPDSLRRSAALHREIARDEPDDPSAAAEALTNAGLALSRAGDRADALALFRTVVDDYTDRDYSRTDRAWIELLDDAAQHEGSATVRALWREATESGALRWPIYLCVLLDQLLGKEVTEIVQELVRRRVARAEQGTSLNQIERITLRRAQAEIDQATTPAAGRLAPLRDTLDLG